jgi:uncharacterized heparinase superfamily protein
MLPEICRAALWRAFAPWRIAWRRSWLYCQFSTGRLTDRIRHYPFDATPRRLDDADSLLRGHFKFAGETVDAPDGSIFDRSAPSRAWAAALHGFDWLPALSSAGGDAARLLAVGLTGEWVERNRRYTEPAWLPEVMARRLIQLFAHGRFILANSDILWRSKLFVSLREQSGRLGRIAREAPPGLPRLEAAAALVLSNTCLDDNPRRLEAGIARFSEEVATQILPDGGHLSRSPEELLSAYRILSMVMDALTETGAPIPADLRSAHDRIVPMLRFFRHGDGALAHFNGGNEGDARVVAALLARDQVRGQTSLHAPHSGYQRLSTAKSLAILDCGPPPPAAYSCRAHAGCLAFEFSVGAQRIVVNCGAETGGVGRWGGALRASAAHSTVTLADTSMMATLAPGLARDLLGPRLLADAGRVETSRNTTSHGGRIEASHDFYLEAFGIRHHREFIMSPEGKRLTGCDRLLPRLAHRSRAAVPFATRFHIHPDIRLSPSQRGDILLKLPNGEGWRFRHGGSVAIEESVYVERDGARHSEQIVLSGSVRDDPVEIAWVFEQMGAD